MTSGLTPNAIPDDLDLTALAERLCAVDGIVGVLLGGSRARGDHTADSDVDLGLYYRGTLDTDALQRLADDVADQHADVTRPGEWGPWVDGGAWLTVNGTAVDWIYRDLDRVQAAWEDAQDGRYAFHAQTGHPLGVPDFTYVGEVALGVVLADPTGQVRTLTESLSYPDTLRQALADGLWEADFLVTLARKAVSRTDTTYVATCLSRALLLCAHALHGRGGRWLVNEKGAITAVGQLDTAPTGFAERAHTVLGTLGTTQDSLTSALDQAHALVSEVTSVCRRPTG